MLEFLFGWIYKPQIELSLLDSIVCYVELVVFLFIGAIIIGYIQSKLEERNKRRRNKKDGRE